ncbi:MAG: hypothetical protein KDA96_17530, partial [Planctomycetaceae bacterium]|nr:hypothetical protein [Planctomycetaceae bacterium]
MLNHLPASTARTAPQWVATSVLAGVLSFVGCSDVMQDGPVHQNQQGGVGKLKTTQEVNEFDPNAGAQEVDSRIRASNPVTAPLEAYGPMKRKVAALGIEHAVNLFNALEGRYPRDHEEFMQRIIRENN